MEKKSIAVLIVTGAMVLGLSACGTNGATSDNADSSQSTSTPVVTEPVDTSNQTQEVEKTTPDTAETTPVSKEENPVSKEVGPKFTEVNETVYATTSVNVRSSYSADSDKVGSLSSGASATRTGVGDNGWSRIVYGDSVAYVSSDYLTTTKPSTNTGSTQTSKPSTNTSKPSTNTGSTQTSKPSTGSSSSSGSTSSGGTQSGSNQMTSEEFQDWASQWGGVGTDSENHVDPNDPGYQDWLTGQLNGG